MFLANLMIKYMKKSKLNIIGFTIIELLVVITILAILGTVWFISYISYISSSRDASRLSQIQIINQAFQWYIKGKLPLPDNKVIIYANWTIIWYQWYAWENILSEIWVKEWWKDPLDKSYFTYFLDSDQKYIQFLPFLENEIWWEISYNPLINQAKAADYTDRFPRPYGAKLWVMVESWSNSPIQDNSNLATNGLDIVTTTNNYIAYLGVDKILYGSWLVLQKLQQSIMYWWVWFWAPRECPEWFLRVPWNEDFNQPWFCVMKYEATYEDATVPNSTVPDILWNTVQYQVWKIPVSKPLLYPIAEINQQQAIDSCKSMWDWYNLITNDEWMTIARNIEQQNSNWSWWTVWTSWIFRWITNELNTTTSLWCKTIDSSWNHSRIAMSSPLNIDTTKWGTQKWSDCDSKRQLQLSNWEIIWDLSGNIWEHVNKANTLDWTWYATWTNPDPCSVTDGTYEWTACNSSERTLYWPSNASRWNTHWMWWVLDYDGVIFIRGADAGLSANAGIFALALSWTGSTFLNDTGFRCAK